MSGKEPKFEMLQRVHVKSVPSRRFVGEIVDLFQDDDGEWFYSIDRKNYLHEPMIEAEDAAAKDNEVMA